MTARGETIRIIQEHTRVVAAVTEDSNLYTDLGFDSLSFVALLAEIEEIFDITFDISEMEVCLRTDGLLALVESKMEERGND